MIPGHAQWVKGSRVATAVAQIQFLARELPYAVGASIKKKKKKKKTTTDEEIHAKTDRSRVATMAPRQPLNFSL